MKHVFLTVAFSLTAFACGHEPTSSDVSSANSAEQPQVEAETMIQDVTVEAVNAGINPDAFAYLVKGRIMTGSNRCQAAGAKAFLKETTVGSEIHVIPMLSKPTENTPRICTREFMPQYADVALTVRDSYSDIHRVLLKNVDMMGTDRDLNSFILTEAETIVSDLNVEPMEAAEDEFSYRISGRVMLGTNSCFAAGATAAFTMQTLGDKITLTPVKTQSLEAENRICIMLYSPVYVTISKTVTGKKSDVSSIEVMNVDGENLRTVIDIK